MASLDVSTTTPIIITDVDVVDASGIGTTNSVIVVTIVIIVVDNTTASIERAKTV